ncbi:MAG: HD domain-containing protein [Clostridiaceae bacterium]|nr:HD domain-containing protein [Clostridiaceae bacterium]
MKYFKINIPEYVQLIINKLNENGYEAYVVGGCVRDSILQKIPMDWDITTSAEPCQVKHLFSQTYDTGIMHGTVTVLMDGKACEVTTFRVDGAYQKHRKPAQVSFTDNIIEDLKRRDFTMNAIAYHPDIGFVDPFNGNADIENKIIRCVGTAADRFEEDALRMLRAVRFACQLDFDIEPDTYNAICNKARLIAAVSKERIREELNKILLSDKPEKLIYLSETGLMPHIMEELEACFRTQQNHPYHAYSVGMHTIKAIESAEKDIVLRWAMLLHDIGKPLCRTTDDKGIDHFYGHGEKSVEIAYKILKRFKFDNKTISRIIRLIKWHDRPIEAHPRAVRKAVVTVGEDIFLDLLKVKEADIKAQNASFMNERMKRLAQIREIYFDIKESGQCLSIKDLAVNGRDLILLGIPEGERIGMVLHKLLDTVIENPKMNTKEILLDIAKKYV